MNFDLQMMAKKIRKDILNLTFLAKNEGSHIGGALSSTDILCTLYGKILKLNIENKLDPDRDRFILSKGHAAIALYATLHQFGFISDNDLYSFEKDHSKFQTHCIKNTD